MSQINGISPWDHIVNEVLELLHRFTNIDKNTLRNTLSEPPDPKYGDLATTIAFRLAKTQRKNPAMIAKEIVEKMNANGLPSVLSEVKTAGPYINFYINRSELAKITIERVISQDLDYGVSNAFEGLHAIVEFPAVNPSKPWHIGHARNAIVGDTVSNLLEKVGYRVTRLDYINDLGLQVAQLIWKLRKLSNINTDEKFDHFLGKLYVEVQKEIESDPSVEEEIRETSRLMESGNNEISDFASDIVTRCVKAQYATAYRLNIFHDLQIWESTLAHSHLLDEVKKQILNKVDSVFVMPDGEKAGCIVARLDVFEEFKDMRDPYKVLFRSDGTRTYVGADISLQMWKFGLIKDPFKYSVFDVQPNGKKVLRSDLEGETIKHQKVNKVFNVVGAEQAHPQRLVYLILDLLGYKKESENSYHLAYERVTVDEASLSGRKGGWVGFTTDDVLDRAFEIAQKEVKMRNPNANDEFISTTAEQIAIGAVRYALIRQSLDKRIDFKYSEVLDFNGDTGPYLQYAHARASRILERVGMFSKPIDYSQINNDYEFALIKMIAKYPSILVEIVQNIKKETWGTDIQLNRIPIFIYELANLFSKFYDNCPVSSAKNESLKNARLALVYAFKKTLASALNIIGVPPLEKM